MPKIRLTQPTGVSGTHHPVGAELEIGTHIPPHEARYLVGIHKAVHVHDAPQAGEIQSQEPPLEIGDPKTQKAKR